MRLVFDIETDGLYFDATKVHVINTLDLDTGEAFSFHDRPDVDARNGFLADGMTMLKNAYELAGHNIIAYDIPVLQKLWPGFAPVGKVFDTLVCTSVIWTALADSDHAKIRSGRLPHKFQQLGLIGAQSLEAWGFRLGELKGTFGEGLDDKEKWKVFTPEMAEYARQDVVVTKKLYELIQRQAYSPACLELEHRVRTIVARQTRLGFRVDMDKILELSHKLQARRAELEGELQKLFQPWEKSLGMFTPKRDNKRLGYKAGVPVEKFKTVVFNPGSRDQIADRLIALRGWNPTVFTASGKPQVDEKVLAELPWPEARTLSEYLEVAKHLGQVSEGDKAWLTLARKDSRGQWRLHGDVRTNGAVTGRMSHSNPNLAQIPSDHDFRVCFIPSAGMVLVGCDAEGIELRMLAHYMARWDGGAYAKTVSEGRKEDKTDVHNVNMRAIGLNDRNNSKTWIYAYLYGAGNFKLGTIVLADMTEEDRNAFYKTYTTKDKREREIKRLGGKGRDCLQERLPALGKLVEAVQSAAARGYLVGLDGRRLHVRGSHAALNTLLQGGGAVVMKQALVMLEDSTGGTIAFVANVHDEFQMEVVREEAETLGRQAADSIRKAGEHFNLRCPLAGSFAIGPTWGETH